MILRPFPTLHRARDRRAHAAMIVSQTTQPTFDGPAGSPGKALSASSEFTGLQGVDEDTEVSCDLSKTYLAACVELFVKN